MNFSKEQLVTLVSDRNQIVIANAGSGKTTILVEKFLQLIKSVQPSEIQRIIAITFTKKAASEMKDRIISRLNEEIEELKRSNSKENEFFKNYQLLMEYRENLSGAKVQTIHSFCQDILKEYAVEVGYSPYFSIIEDTQLDELFDRFYKETLEEFLTNERIAPISSEVFFDAVSKYNFQKIISMFFGDNNLSENFESNVRNVTAEEYSNKLTNKIIPEYIQVHKNLVNELLEIKELLIEENTKKKTLDPFFEKIDNGYFENFQDAIELIEKMALFWNDIKIVKINGNRTLPGYFRDPDKFKNETEIFKSFGNSKYLNSFHQLLQYIDSFYSAMNAKYEDYKLENSLITFNDMLLKTELLLRKEEIAERIRKKIDYLLIDEFQDTDDVQYSIVKSIITSIAYNKDSTGNWGKLFIVGDPKQSIYGFRNADVRVMKKAEKEVMESNNLRFQAGEINKKVEFSDKNFGNHTLELTPDETSGKIELKISHRLNVVNTCFVNLMFSKLMVENQFDYSVGYNPFILARNIPYLELDENEIEIKPNTENDLSFGAVQFLLNITNNKPKEGVDEKRNDEESKTEDAPEEIINSDDAIEEQEDENEAVLVAKYISNLISSGTQIFDSKDGNFHTLNYSDIGILVRKRSGVDKLLKQLDDKQIPYFMNDSKNFFQTQEILDIISFIKFLYNNEDDLAFASLIKSNFFGFTDYEILQISEHSGVTLWNSFISYSEGNQNYKVLRSKKLLEYYKNNYSNFSLHKLLLDILDQTNYKETYFKSPSKNSIHLNIKSFLNFIKKMTKSGLNSLTEIIIEIDKSYVEKMDGEDALVLNENSINLLTIHKSKGLEFPVVILYNTNSKVQNAESILFNNDLGLVFKFNQVNEANKLEEITLPQHFLLSKYHKLKDEEELKRLLYVATTRAKDLLVITTSLTLVKNIGKDGSIFQKNSGLFKLVSEAIGLIFTDIGDISDNFFKTYQNTLTLYKHDTYKNIKFDFNIQYYSNIIQSNSENQDKIYLDNSILMMDEFQTNPPFFENSASKIQILSKNPTNFVERYLLNTPEIFRSNDFPVKDGILQGNIRGDIIHKVISNFRKWINSQNEIKENELSDNLLNLLKKNEIENTETYIKELTEEIKAVFQSLFLTNHFPEFQNSEIELEMEMPFGNDFIKVIIDALVPMSDGTYEIWDWKSNLVRDEEKFNKLAANYEFQLKYYAFVLSFLYPEQENFICRLFFTRLAASAGQDSDWIATFEWTRKELMEFSNEIEIIFERLHNPKEMYNLLLENL